MALKKYTINKTITYEEPILLDVAVMRNNVRNLITFAFNSADKLCTPQPKWCYPEFTYGINVRFLCHDIYFLLKTLILFSYITETCLSWDVEYSFHATFEITWFVCNSTNNKHKTTKQCAVEVWLRVMSPPFPLQSSSKVGALIFWILDNAGRPL
jgi:hypothetical protein